MTRASVRVRRTALRFPNSTRGLFTADWTTLTLSSGARGEQPSVCANRRAGGQGLLRTVMHGDGVGADIGERITIPRGVSGFEAEPGALAPFVVVRDGRPALL